MIENNGAQGRIRTTDTRIFSPLLYQLSYLGLLGNLVRRGLSCKPEDEPTRRPWLIENRPSPVEWGASHGQRRSPAQAVPRPDSAAAHLFSISTTIRSATPMPTISAPSNGATGAVSNIPCMNGTVGEGELRRHHDDHADQHGRRAEHAPRQVSDGPCR